MSDIETPQFNEMLLGVQRRAFGYFTHETNLANGLVKDKTADNWPASIAAVGMALTSYPIGVERGLMTRAHALRRSLTTLRFFMASEQSQSPTATGYKGFYYHFLDMQSGRRAWNCELSSIDTTLLIAGMLTAAAYFDRVTDDERELRTLAEALYARVDWPWMQAGQTTVCHGWKPRGGFLRWHWEGYDEALLLYLLALGSPTHPVGAQAWDAWASTYEWRNVEGIDYLHAGSLFIHQMSHVWVDLRGIQDAFMRAHDCDYFENSRRATLIQQRYAVRNPGNFKGYGEYGWGITASDGPGCTLESAAHGKQVFFDYIARSVPWGPDDGTLAPWAVIASLPFAPHIVIPTVTKFHRMRLHMDNPYGFKASFNPSFSVDSRHEAGWVSSYHFGINVGPTVMMIENHLSGLVWRLMRGCAPVHRGLQRAGFQGGWLAAPGGTATVA